MEFIKYHNAAVVILGVILLLGTSVFASETGREALGQKQTKIEGVDNSILLATDLAAFDMDFKIEKIEKQEDVYLVSFSSLDLVKNNNVWEYQSKEKQLKISQKTEGDLATKIAQELKDIYQSRTRELKKEQAKAQETGAQSRTEVVEYTGLIGQTLDLAGNFFPGFQSVSKKDLPLAASLAAFKELPRARAEETDIRLNTNAPAGDYDLTNLVQNALNENLGSSTAPVESASSVESSEVPVPTETPIPSPAESPLPSSGQAPAEVIETPAGQ